MTKYEELKARQIFTVGELKKALEKYPEDTRLQVSDGDIGGYDVCERNYVTLNFYESENHSWLRIGHDEYIAYEAFKNGEITEEQRRRIYD